MTIVEPHGRYSQPETDSDEALTVPIRIPASVATPSPATAAPTKKDESRLRRVVLWSGAGVGGFFVLLLILAVVLAVAAGPHVAPAAAPVATSAPVVPAAKPTLVSVPTPVAAPTPAPAAAPAPVSPPIAQPAPVASPAPVATVPDWQHICRVDTGNGVYFLLIDSAQAHDWSACGDGPEVFGSNIDVMMNQPGMDRRCLVPPTTDADIAVYSDTHRGDLAAARSYCDDLGGTN